MTSVATAPDIQIEALEARLLMQRIRRALDGSPIYFRAYLKGLRLADVLESVVTDLRRVAANGQLDNMSDEEFEDFTEDLAKLYELTGTHIAAARNLGLHRHILHRRYFKRIVESTDRIGSLVETFLLGADQDFAKLAVEVVTSLPK